MLFRLKTSMFAIIGILFAGSGILKAQQPVQAKINLVYPETKEVMIYQGSDNGITEGMVLQVSRGGRVIGQVTVTKTFPKLCRAQITNINSGEEIRVGDDAGTEVPAAAAAGTPAGATVTITPEQPAAGETQPSEPQSKKKKRSEETSSEAAPAETAPAAESAPAEEEGGKKKKKKDEGEQAAAAETAPAAPVQAPKIPTKPWRQFGYIVMPASHGLSGLMSMPTFDSRPKGSAVLKYGGIQIEDKYTDSYIASVTYGLDNDLELCIGLISYDEVSPQPDDVIIYAAKYTFSVTGFYHDKINKASIGFQEYSSDNNNSGRLFLVSGLAYEGGALHFGLQVWQGDQADVSKYNSLGVLLGWQRTFNKVWTFMLEYDSLSPLGPNSWSVGFRYHQRPLLNWEFDLRDFNKSHAKYFEASLAHTF